MRILVIEDDAFTLEFLSKKLREQGYAVDTSEEGEVGLYKARSCDYDALILDVNLPGLNGWELLKRLRKTKKTPVVMLSSCSSIEERVRGLDAGADDYITKPFELPELFARLRAVIRRSAQHARSTIEIGDVIVDLSARSVSRSGEVIPLTPREYAIVEYLAMHRGKIVSRTALFEHLCDENDDTLSNVIDVHVGKIRKKLGRNFIATHHGLGYCC